jgi:hypothetical protein
MQLSVSAASTTRAVSTATAATLITPVAVCDCTASLKLKGGPIYDIRWRLPEFGTPWAPSQNGGRWAGDTGSRWAGTPGKRWPPDTSDHWEFTPTQ